MLPHLGARLHRVRAFGHDVLLSRTMSPRMIAIRSCGAATSWRRGAIASRPSRSRSAAGPSPWRPTSATAGHPRTGLPSAPGGSRRRARSSSAAAVTAGRGATRSASGSPSTAPILRVDAVGRRTSTTLPCRRASASIPGSSARSSSPSRPRPSTPNDDTPATPVPVAGETDLRRLGPPPIGLDGTWVDVARAGRAALAAARLPGHDACRSAPTTCIVVASPPGRGAIAVEPETHAPQGIRRLLGSEPDALAMLPPGERLTLAMELAFERR